MWITDRSSTEIDELDGTTKQVYDAYFSNNP
jgi:hypothetical protein